MLTTPWTSPPRDSPRGEPDKQGYGPFPHLLQAPDSLLPGSLPPATVLS